MKIIFIILIIIAIGLGAFFVLSRTNKQIPAPLITAISVLPIPVPTPVPFYDLTIPYLRQREYKSNLGSLELLSENSSYSAYLTSYSSDNLKVNGLLTKPRGEIPNGGWPAIIFIHGYIPPAQYRTTQNYASYVDFLARNGFVVFKIDLRGHDQSEGEPGGGYYSSDYIVDSLNARAALQSSDFVNPQKIGLWGHSMSGNVVSRALAAVPNIPAIVIWAGAVYTYTDFSQYQIEDNSYQPPSPDSESRRKRNELFETHGAFDPENAFWKQVPMTNYLSDIKGAIQIHHAVDDNVVDIQYSRNLMGILDQTSIPHQLYEYQSGGHNITGAGFTQAMQRTVEFFKKYL